MARPYLVETYPEDVPKASKVALLNREDEVARAQGSAITQVSASYGESRRRILIANSDRTLMRIDPADIVAAPAMTTPVSQAYEPAGVKYPPVASAGVMQLDDFDDRLVAVLQRDIESGAVHLMGLQKQWM